MRRVLAVLWLMLPAFLLSGQSAIALYEAGLRLQVEGDHYGAMEFYRASLASNPSYARPMVGLAESFRAIGEYQEALTWIQTARRLERENLDLPQLEASIRMALGDLAAARALYEGVLARLPNDLVSQLGLARLNLLEGRRAAAAESLQRALRVAPDNVDALLQLALIYDELGQSAASEAHLDKALALYSGDPQVHLTAGRHFAARGRLEDARRYLRTALALAPRLTAARLDLARVLIRMGREPEAQELAREALSDQSRLSRREAREVLAITYERTGAVQEALRNYTEALRLAPDDEVLRIAAENLALRHPEEAARSALAVFHLREGVRFEERNYLNLALVEYRRSLRLAPELKDARLRYAGVYLLRGFRFRYLSELIVLRDFFNHRDTGILDDIELYQSRLRDSVSMRWRDALPALEGGDGLADQYSVDRTPLTLALFTVRGQSRTVHFEPEENLVVYVADLMLATDALSVAGDPAVVASFDEAHRRARQLGVDHFAVLAFDETERSFRATIGIYGARTGRILLGFQHLRTGNNRIRDALVRLVEDTAGSTPLQGLLLARRFDRGLVDLGRRHGVKEEDRFLIVRRGAVSLRTDALGYQFSESEVVGDLRIVAVDENVSEGLITPRTFFDRINPADILIPAEPSS